MLHCDSQDKMLASKFITQKTILPFPPPFTLSFSTSSWTQATIYDTWYYVNLVSLSLSLSPSVFQACESLSTIKM